MVYSVNTATAVYRVGNASGWSSETNAGADNATYATILTISFDEEYSRTQGIPVAIINYILIGLVALTIVINIRVVGIILVISLLTIPQATANLISKNFKSIIFYSIGFGFLSSISGLFLSYKFNIPSGATIIFSSILIFLIVRLGLYFYTRVRIRRG